MLIKVFKAFELIKKCARKKRSFRKSFISYSKYVNYRKTQYIVIILFEDRNIVYYYRPFESFKGFPLQSPEELGGLQEVNFILGRGGKLYYVVCTAL